MPEHCFLTYQILDNVDTVLTFKLLTFYVAGVHLKNGQLTTVCKCWNDEMIKTLFLPLRLRNNRAERWRSPRMRWGNRPGKATAQIWRCPLDLVLSWQQSSWCPAEVTAQWPLSQLSFKTESQYVDVCTQLETEIQHNIGVYNFTDGKETRFKLLITISYMYSTYGL